MKAASIGKLHRGVSIIEILIALAILTLTISAVIIVLFGNQSLAVDTQTNVEALAKAQSQLEEARALAATDFFEVEDLPAAPDDIYQKKLEVKDRSECQKEAISTVSWQQGERDLEVSLSTLFSDLGIALAMGGDCDSTPPGDWDNPYSAVSVGFGGQGATDIDAEDSRIYITSDPSPPGGEDLFIYDFNPATLTLTERSKENVGAGLLALDVADGYAYAVNDGNTSQLFVIDVTDPSDPGTPITRTLPLAPTAVGRSIYYYDHFVYIGTQYLACPPACTPQQNNELHIYDVTNPLDPIWRGSEKVNHNINDIVVRDGYAYLATSNDSGEVMLYDVSDPTNPNPAGVFNAGGVKDATALYLLGNRLYVGRADVTSAGEYDFYILDVSDPTTNPTALGWKHLGMHNNSVVQGIVVKNSLAFLALDDSTVSFRILDVGDPDNITDHTLCSTVNTSENSSAIDMDNDHVFTANRSNDELRVIRDQATACAP